MRAMPCHVSFSPGYLCPSGVAKRVMSCDLPLEQKSLLDLAFGHYMLMRILSEQPHQNQHTAKQELLHWESVQSPGELDKLKNQVGRIEIVRDSRLQHVYFRVPTLAQNFFFDSVDVKEARRELM